MQRIILPNGLGMGQFAPSKNTKCELTVRKWLRAMGLRVHANRRSLPGSPDAAVYALRLAVFADGDFWHNPKIMIARHKPHHRENWTLRAKRGKRREYRANKRLREMGWRVIRIWDSSIKKRPDRTRERLRSLLRRDFARTVRI
jgi:DNA mismatch endonuclease (patch repair protein)